MSAEGSSAGALRTERPRCASATLDVTEESVEFFSPNFDACAVLAAPRVRLPTGFEEVRPLDNLSAARQLIPEIWAASSAPPTGPRHAAARPAATPVAAPAASLVQLWFCHSALGVLLRHTHGVTWPLGCISLADGLPLLASLTGARFPAVYPRE